jgi:hypothetical protein
MGTLEAPKMKEQLTALIEAYSAAQVSGNTILKQFAASHLNQFLSQVEVVKTTPVANPDEDSKSDF